MWFIYAYYKSLRLLRGICIAWYWCTFLFVLSSHMLYQVIYWPIIIWHYCDLSPCASFICMALCYYLTMYITCSINLLFFIISKTARTSLEWVGWVEVPCSYKHMKMFTIYYYYYYQCLCHCHCYYLGLVNCCTFLCMFNCGVNLLLCSCSSLISR